MKSKVLSPLLALVCTVMLQACGGGGSPPPLSPPPVATVQAPERGVVGTTVQVDGGQSTSPAGGQLTYKWDLPSRPTASAATLSATSGRLSSFRPDVAGDYRIRLTVEDATGKTASADRTIVVDPRIEQPPTISRFIAEPGITGGRSVAQFEWTIADPNGDPLTCRLDPIGDGAMHVPVDCQSTIPTSLTYEAPGIYRPTLIATDPSGLEARTDIALTIQGLPTITVLAPSAGGLVGTKMAVSVRISTIQDVTSVASTIGGRSALLTVSSTPACSDRCVATFSGTVDMSDMTPGRQILEVTVTTKDGGLARAILPVTLDFAPSLSLDAPLDASVASPTLRLKGSCQDEVAQGCVIQVLHDNSVLAAQSGTLDQEIDLQAYEGKRITLTFVATDQHNQSTKQTRTVYVEKASQLAAVLSAPGAILDVTRDRVLHQLTTDSGDEVSVLDRALNASTRIPLPQGRLVVRAYLTPIGVAIVSITKGSAVPSYRLHEWDGQALSDLGVMDTPESLSVRGRFAIWNVGKTLLQRDLILGTNRTVSTASGNWRNATAANGAVAWWTMDYQIMFDDGIASRQLTSPDGMWNTYVLTDGQRVVYRKHSPCCTNQRYAIVVHDGISETTLRPAGEQDPQIGTDFQVRDGWVAYTSPGGLGQPQVWTFDPAGARLQRSTLAATGQIETLGDHGQLMLTMNGRRHLSLPNSPLRDINSTLGQSYFIDGDWYVAVGRALYRVPGM